MQVFLCSGTGGPLANEDSSTKIELISKFYSRFREGLFVIHMKDLSRAFKYLLLLFRYPWKLTGRDYWSARNKRSHFFSLNMFPENAVSISKTVNTRAFKRCNKCSAPLKNLLVGITRALETKPKPLSKQKVGSSSKFCVAVFKASMLDSWEVHQLN